MESSPTSEPETGQPGHAGTVATVARSLPPQLTGTFHHKIDSKSRIVLPSGFRESYDAGGYLQEWQGTHLTLFTAAGFKLWVDDSRQRLIDRGLVSASMQTAMRKMTEAAERVEPDAQGRFIIPSRFRDKAPSGSDVTVIGVLDRIEIWRPEVKAQEDPSVEIDLALLQDDYEGHHR